MSAARKLRSQVQDELCSQYVCPEVLSEQRRACLAGQGEQLLAQLPAKPSDEEAQTQFEQQQHLDNPHLFGPKAPQVNQARVAASRLHALLVSNRSRTPGLGHVLQLCKQQAAASGGPLLRLLRRVALWWYYRVSFDPLEQLLALSSSYELLFQLMTPHQQLSCMADILLVLACPALQEHSGQLDTPLHTATLLSMLKMAQQLALAEAALQEQEQQLDSVVQRAAARQERDQDKGCPQQQRLQQQEVQLTQAACSAAAVITPPGLALLQLCRQQCCQVSGLPASHIPPQGLWPQGCDQTTKWFKQRFGLLLTAAVQQDSGSVEMVGSLQAQVAFQQAEVCKRVGALLSQLPLLPHAQLLLWYYAQEPAGQQAAVPEPSLITGAWLQQCCAALQADSSPDLLPGQDPISTLLAWVLSTMAACKQPGPRQGRQQLQAHAEDAQGQEGQHQQEQEEGPQQHPAEALRQLLDVLLGALQYRHALSMSELEVGNSHRQGQSMLLAALHSHCMQLMLEARNQLPPEACRLGRTASASSCCSSTSSSRHGSGSEEQQRQRRAWQLCLSQVQHDLLLVVQLMRHWQHHNAFGSFEKVLRNQQHSPAFLADFLRPTPGADRHEADMAAAQFRASRHQQLMQHYRQLGATSTAAATAAATPTPGSAAAHRAHAAAGAAAPAPPGSAARDSGSGSRHCSEAGTSRPAVSPAAEAAPAAATEFSGPRAVLAARVMASAHQLLDQIEAVPRLPALQRHTPAAVLSAMQECCIDDEVQLAHLLQYVNRLLLHAFGLTTEEAAENLQELQGIARKLLPCRIIPGNVSQEQLVVQMQMLLRHLGAGELTPAAVRAWRQVLAATWQQTRLQHQQQPQQGLARSQPGAAGAGPSSSGVGGEDAASGDDASSVGSVLRIRGGWGGGSDASASDLGVASGDEEQQQPEQAAVAAYCGPSSGGDAASLSLRRSRRSIDVQSSSGGSDVDLPYARGGPLPLPSDDEEAAEQLGGFGVPTAPPMSPASAALSCPASPPAAPAAAAAAAAAYWQGSEGGAGQQVQAGSSAAEYVSGAAAGYAASLPCSDEGSVAGSDDADSSAAGAFRALEVLQAFWRTRLRRGRPLPQEADLEAAAPAQLPGSFSSIREHFQCMDHYGAAAWVDLAATVAQAGIASRPFVDQLKKLESVLRRLGLKPPAYQQEGGVDMDPALGEAWWIVRDASALATLTLLLAEPHMLFGHSQQAWGVWQEGEEVLLRLLEEASLEVRGSSDELQETLRTNQHSAGYLFNACLRDRVSGRQDAAMLPAGLRNAAFDTVIGEDLSGLPDAVEVLVGVLRDLLQALGPVEVAAYSGHTGIQDDVMSSAKELERWRRLFRTMLDVLKHLVDVNAWLASMGRHAQRDAKLCRRLSRVLLWGSHDPFLAWLHQLCKPDAEATATALREAVVAHKQLQAALESGLARDCWGVMQRAFNLAHPQVFIRDADVRRERDALAGILQPLVADMLRHVCHTSASMPDLPVPDDSFSTLASLLSPETRQDLLFTFSCIQPAICSFWFLLPRQPAGTAAAVTERAEGSVLPLIHASFTSRAGRRSRKAAARRHGGSAAPASQAAGDDSSSSCCSGESDSTGRRRGVRETSCFADGVVHSELNQLYCPLVDPAVTGTMRSATAKATWLAEELEQLQASLDSMWADLAQPDVSQEQQQWLMQDLEDSQQAMCAVEEELQQARQQCLEEVQRLPTSAQWQRDSRQSLSHHPLPEDSASSCAGGSGDDSGGSCSGGSSSSDSEQQQQPTGLQGSTRHHTAAAAAAVSQDRRQERQRRRWAKHAARYQWGPCRPWHLQRARLLVVRQRLLNQVARLQQSADAALQQHAALCDKLTVSGAQPAATQQQQGPDDGSCLADKLTEQLARLQQVPAAGQRGSVAAVAAAAEAAGLGAATPTILTLQTGSRYAGRDSAGPSVGRISHVERSLQATLSALVRMAPQVDQAQQQLQQACGADSPLLAEMIAGRARQRQQQHGQQGSGDSTRQLLWQVLQQVKPAACKWYETGAQHHLHRQQQQQVKQGKGVGGVNAPAGLTAAASVPDCTSPGLWSTLTRSLASDLLLVPPSIRDMVANGWAAGAGRLGAGVAPAELLIHGSEGTTNSSRRAARMLAVQYARAARQQYAKKHHAGGMLWSLLALQLLADNPDLLTELQEQSAQAISSALATHTTAAAAGMLPVLAAAGALAGVPLQPGSSQWPPGADTPGCAGDCSSGGSDSGSSRANAGRTGNGNAAGPALGSGAGNSSSGGAAPASCLAPSLLHLSSQMCCCFIGPPSQALPWLQLLARYHALADVKAQHGAVRDARNPQGSSGSSTSSSRQPWDPSLEAQARVAAMAVALESFDAPLPAFAKQLCSDVLAQYDGLEGVPVVAAPVTTGATAALQQSLQMACGHAQQQQPAACCGLQQQLETCALWLHAERLLRVEPAEWEQHLAQHLLPQGNKCTGSGISSGGSSSGGGSSSSSSAAHNSLLAGQACDWCGGGMPAAAAARGSGKSRGSGSQLGCPSCGAAQYCSKACAEGAKRVHAANCWRLQALAANGLCWQQAAFQTTSGSGGRTRSMWDLSSCC